MDYNVVIENFEKIVNSNKMFIQSNPASHRIATAKLANFSSKLNIWIIKYSKGDSLSILKIEFSKLILLLENVWNDYKIKASTENNEEANELLYDHYVRVLWATCIGILLGSEYELDKIRSLMKKSNLNDLVFNYIFNNLTINNEEELLDDYKYVHLIPEKFDSLRKIIMENDREVSRELIVNYLNKDWLSSYNEFGNGTGLEKTKKLNEGKYYYGFWAFDVAAIAKLKGFEEEEFKGLPYFPTFKDR